MGENAVDTAFDDLKRWAKTAEFPEPIRWSDVETRIMAHSPPPRDQLDPRLKRNERLRSAIGFLFLLPEIVVVFGSSVVGLVFVVAHVLYDRTVPEDGWLVIFLRIEFIAAVVVSVFPVLMWWTTKRRGRWDFLISGGTSVASLASFLLLIRTPQPSGWAWIEISALLAAVAGFVTFLFMLVATEPGIRRPWRERFRAVTPEERWYRGMRAGVLEQLAKRDLVVRHDIPDMVEMPLGTWQELDSPHE